MMFQVENNPEGYVVAADWADEVGVKACTIIWRLKAGKTVEEALAKRDYRKIK